MSESFEHAGLMVKIKQDSDYESPREWDNLGKMVCWHRRYKLGDEHEYKDSDHLLSDLFSELDWGAREARAICLQWAKYDKESYREFLSWKEDESREEFWGWVVQDKIIDDRMSYAPKEVKEMVALLVEEKFAILPLYLYDHSGITMNTTGFTCKWDSGQVGYIYMSMEDANKEFEAMQKYLQEHPEWFEGESIPQSAEEAAIQRLKGEVETYDQYLTGDVWGYVIEDEDGNDLESCWGFYGQDYCIKEAKSVAESIAKKLAHDYQI